MSDSSLEKPSLGKQIRDTLIRSSARETAAVWATLIYMLFQLFRHVFPGFLSLTHTFGQKILYLPVH